jgi:hypothetical protein
MIYYRIRNKLASWIRIRHSGLQVPGSGCERKITDPQHCRHMEGRDLTNDVHGEGDEPVMPDQEREEVATIDHNAKLFHQGLPVEEIVGSWKRGNRHFNSCSLLHNAIIDMKPFHFFDWNYSTLAGTEIGILNIITQKTVCKVYYQTPVLGLNQGFYIGAKRRRRKNGYDKNTKEKHFKPKTEIFDRTR